MIIKRKRTIKIIGICLAALFAFSFTITDDGGKKTTYKGTLKAGDAYRLFINNIDMPMNRTGVMANVSIDGREGGLLDGKTFLFSGGFYLSGITNGVTWANAVASASRTEDYEAGTVEFGKTDPRAQLYVVSQKDGDFAESWDEWKDAVDLGAYYHDGNGNGVYDPADDNGNGKWDPTEDRPDLIGDETVWCVYHDGLDPALRTFNNVDPQGIEIRQTVFAFASKGITGNMIFLRYSIVNTGLKADVIDSVYFGVWADADIGNLNDAYFDDLVGCDTTLNAGFTYNNGDDADWGINPPCFLIDFFQGPLSYIPGETFIDNDGDGEYTDGVDTPLDTASHVQGQVRGIAQFPGARNLGLSSFMHYMQSHAEVGDPAYWYEARNYMFGLNKFGDPLDPCLWAFGEVRGGVPCEEVDKKFWYSGDPVTDVGWINIFEEDQRQMSNTGPFKLVKGQPVDIVVGYVVGRGTDALNSVTVAKEYDLTAQILFDANFPSPPAPPQLEAVTQNGSNFFNITWDTDKQVNYNAVDTVLQIDRRLQGFYVTAFKTNSKALTVNGIENAKVIANFQLDNFIKNIYQAAPNGGEDLIFKDQDPEFKIDSLIYGDPETGRIRIRINQDPFTGGPLVKGHEYYFSITQYHLNHAVIVERESGEYGPEGDYLDPSGSGIEEWDIPIVVVTFGEDLYAPAVEVQSSNKISGASFGEVGFEVINNADLRGDAYEVTFFKDSSASSYSTFWQLDNVTTGTVLIDSGTAYTFGSPNINDFITDGFITKIEEQTATIGTPEYDSLNNIWFQDFSAFANTGVFYLGDDIPQGTTIDLFPGGSCDQIGANNLMQIELRFGDPGKAYRYVNGYIGFAGSGYPYAAEITPSDTVGKGVVGNWDELNDRANGFVDVPFTAWIVDENYGVEQQLAVGFVERARKPQFPKGTPDGIWDPTDSVKASGEMIIIFNAPYDPEGNQIEYTGGDFNTPGGVVTVWADLLKSSTSAGEIPEDAIGITEEQRAIFDSPWFNSMYVVGFSRKDPSSFYTNGEVLNIPLDEYPYTEADVYQFQTREGGELTLDEKKALWDKVNVFPNPLFGFNPATSYTNNSSPDNPFVTFSNLPEEITIKIFTLSGTLVRTLTTAVDKSYPTSIFLRWDLENEDGLRVASGLYLAIISSPQFGEKILKFSIVMPQKQIERF